MQIIWEINPKMQKWSSQNTSNMLRWRDMGCLLCAHHNKGQFSIKLHATLMERSDIGQPLISQKIFHTCFTGILQGVFCEHLDEVEFVLMEYILFQIMARPLFATKPLSESMLSTRSYPTNFSEGQIKIPIFLLRKHIWICYRQIDAHLVSGYIY